MSRNVPNSKIRELAQWLLAYEAARDNVAEANMPARALVAEKLRRPLVTLTGIAGFRSLLARALTLAKAQAPALNIVQIEPDGSLAGFGNDEAQIEEAGLMLIAQLLGLLVTFIGERLMLTLVRDAWPDLPILDDWTLEKK
jgi:hypothetical protein